MVLSHSKWLKKDLAGFIATAGTIIGLIAGKYFYFYLFLLKFLPIGIGFYYFYYFSKYFKIEETSKDSFYILEDSYLRLLLMNDFSTSACPFSEIFREESLISEIFRLAKIL